MGKVSADDKYEDDIMTILWLKALHVIAVISWMAGMLYLPRLFVYHTETEKGSTEEARFRMMELRLYRFIMTPAMLATWVFGIAMIAQNPGYMTQGWLHVKLLLVLILTGVHGYFGKLRRDFAEDRNTHGVRFYKVINEMPTLLMVGIVILAVVKPF
jgi:putative membrane protein